ncbi:MAG: hypothetical protein PUB42_02765 [Firmicutes bacterium]|nr:hypothetical protein [Bacillota bacterium]
MIIFLLPKKSVLPNITGKSLIVGCADDLSATAYADGAEKFMKEFGCDVSFVTKRDGCDVFLTSGCDFSGFQPITKFVDKHDKLYTRSIIENNCSKDGEIYGISNILMGSLSYCEYDEAAFDADSLPYNLFRNHKWNRDNFIFISGKDAPPFSADWSDSTLNIRYAFSTDNKGNIFFDYGSQPQIEWLNFLRTLIYDNGMAAKENAAFQIGFLPQLMLGTADYAVQRRYIPLPSKHGKMQDIFVTEYHFSVPETASDPQASVMLANYMIRACSDTRLSMYEANMTAEDFALFKKQLQKFYTFPPVAIPKIPFVSDFVRGKTVTEHIYNVKNNVTVE